MINTACSITAAAPTPIDGNSPTHA